MAMHIKKIAFLISRADLDLSAFRHYWEHTHGPLVGSSPGYATWRRRYVQDHPIRPGPGGGAFVFAGIAEFWLPHNAPREEEYVLSPIYRDRIAPDEDQFIDKGATLSLRAREQVLRAGQGPVKLIQFGRWSGLVTDDIMAGLLAALSSGGLTDALRDWRVDHVVPGSTRLPTAETVSGLDLDYVETLRFDTEDDAIAHLNAASERRAMIYGTPMTSLFVRERVFVADGVFLG